MKTDKIDQGLEKCHFLKLAEEEIHKLHGLNSIE